MDKMQKKDTWMIIHLVSKEIHKLRAIVEIAGWKGIQVPFHLNSKGRISSCFKE